MGYPDSGDSRFAFDRDGDLRRYLRLFTGHVTAHQAKDPYPPAFASRSASTVLAQTHGPAHRPPCAALRAHLVCSYQSSSWIP